jgi:hypothetical protein
MPVILARSRKIHQVDAIQTLKITSGSLSKDVSSSVMSKHPIADLLLKTMLLSMEPSVPLAEDLTALQRVVGVVMVLGAQQMRV